MSGAGDVETVLAELQSRASEAYHAGQARYGINTARSFGVSLPDIRVLAKPHRGDHELARALWASGWREARILATIIADPERAEAGELDAWAGDSNSWEVTDGLTSNYVRRTAFAWGKAMAWPADEREFVRRAGFALQADLAVHDKQAGDDCFEACLPLVRTHAVDERNFVKKAVNWSLRQIGKRNIRLNALAIVAAEALAAQDSRSARWIGHHALRELRSDKVQARLRGL